MIHVLFHQWLYLCRCTKCDGKGKLPCATCGSRGLLKCETCHGRGSLLSRKIAVVKWKTLSTRKVSATSGAASVPDEIFHRARCSIVQHSGISMHSGLFHRLFSLNKFSSDVIADRASVPPTARAICERHTISVMRHCSQSFSFYIVGYSREVSLKDYYPARFCRGLCPCLEWLKV